MRLRAIEEPLEETDEGLEVVGPRADKGLHAGEVLHRQLGQIDLRGRRLDLEDSFAHKGGVEIVGSEVCDIVVREDAMDSQTEHDGKPEGEGGFHDWNLYTGEPPSLLNTQRGCKSCKHPSAI